MENQTPEANGLKEALIAKGVRALAIGKALVPSVVSSALILVATGFSSWLLAEGLSHGFRVHVGWGGLTLLIYVSASLAKGFGSVIAKSLADSYHSSVREHEAYKAQEESLNHLLSMLSKFGAADERKSSDGAYL